MRKPLIIALILALAILPVQAREVTITVLATTDTHGNVSGYDYATETELDYGLAQAASQINNMRRERKNLILVDLGDSLSGDALPFYHRFFEATQPNPVINAMNEMEYDVAVPGNHDFDYGTEYLLAAVGQSRFPWTSANIFPEGGSETLFPETVVVERDGVKVGFFGLTTPVTRKTQPPANIDNVLFTDMVQAATKAVATLEGQGADVIVALAHSGRGDKMQTGENFENAVYQVAENVPGITAILFGHTHEEVSFELHNNVLLCQPRDHARSIGVLMIDLQQRDGKWEILAKTSTSFQTIGMKADRKVEKATKSINAACERFADEVLGDYNRELIVSGDPLNPGSSTFTLVDSVKHWKDADVVMLPMQSPEETIKSERTSFRNRHMLKLVPYDNYFVRFQVTGQQLDTMLELAAAMLGSDGKLKTGVPFYHFDYCAGVQYRLNPLNTEGQRVEITAVNRKDFDEAAIYTVAMTGYQYGMERFFAGEIPEPLEWSDRTLRQMVRSLVLDMQESE